MRRYLATLAAVIFTVPALGASIGESSLTLPAAGTLGTNVGGGSDGVIVGAIATVSPDDVLLRSLAEAGLCVVNDGGLYTTETTDFGEATADDIDALPATPANGDEIYFGHASDTFARVDVNLTTQGAGTWTITYYYWDGDSYEAVTNPTDGTTGFTATTGWKSITFDLPGDWAQNTVNGVLGYWIKGVVSGYSAVTTQPLLGQGYVIVDSDDATWTDDTTDATDAGTGDVALLPSYPVVGDGIFVCDANPFFKLKTTYSQARTGTATLTAKYWDGDSWEDLGDVDDTAGWSTAAGTELIHWDPPSDWTANTAANGPNGQAGYCISFTMTAITDVTQQPLATQMWTIPSDGTGSDGVRVSHKGTVTRVDMVAMTASATNADSKFLLFNFTRGTHVPFTWTGADTADQVTVSMAVLEDDELGIAQIQEDGTTEFAAGGFVLSIDK